MIGLATTGMRKTVEFEYDIGQEVKIIPTGIRGNIDSLTLDNMGKQYRVVYWNDGQRYSVWMYLWEIKDA
jgi:hypothetical protein